MAKAKPTLALSPSRDIPLDQLFLSPANVRRTKSGDAIGQLADDIARRGLLQSLNVRPELDGEGQATGRFEIPAGGRRFRALELLVKQKRLAKDVQVPCVVRAANDDILAEDDSLAENAMRENLHPLDQFCAMQAMVDKGDDVEEIAAHFFVTPAVVRQRLKLAAVSPKLHEVYAEDGMSLEQLMAFTVSDDHERQLLVFEMMGQNYNCSPAFIRQKLTENSVRAVDKRVRFVGVDAYVEAGGSIVRDLFEADQGGWLTDPALIDRLTTDKLEAEAARVGGEGWKWIESAIEIPWGTSRGLRAIFGEEVPMDEAEEKQLAELEAEGEALSAEWSDADEVPDEVHARLEVIDAEIGAIAERPQNFDPAEVAIAGVFVSLEHDGSLRVERGFVRPEDEPGEDAADEAASEDGAQSSEGSAEGDAGGVSGSAPTGDDLATLLQWARADVPSRAAPSLPPPAAPALPAVRATLPAQVGGAHGEARRSPASACRPLPAPVPSPRNQPRRSGTPEAARRLWTASKSILGSLGEDYLEGRSIVTVSASDPLRYHRHCFYRPSEDDAPGGRPAWPAMIAAVTDLGGTITGVHRTWLDPETRDKAPVAYPRSRRTAVWPVGEDGSFSRNV